MVYQNSKQVLSGLTLSKPTAYIDRYDNTLLQSVPRSLNREQLGLYPDNLPFTGEDIWTLYEISWLNSKGVPQVAIGRVVVAADSQNLIESKSFKLYLNSFNQTFFTHWGEVQLTLEHDLSACSAGHVSVKLFRLEEIEGQPIGVFTGEILDNQDITITNYALNADYLTLATGSEIVQETLVSHLIKSNCLISHQPDWGSVMVRYKGPRINREALLRYLISFRQHNEFHEQCVERIFNDIQCLCHPEALTVYARYTRRGGLDINPWRSNVPFSPCYARLIRQ